METSNWIIVPFYREDGTTYGRMQVFPTTEDCFQYMQRNSGEKGLYLVVNYALYQALTEKKIHIPKDKE